jgi:hypothetical protein
MCKEMPVIPANKVVDLQRIIGKKWRAEEEEKHKSLTKNTLSLFPSLFLSLFFFFSLSFFFLSLSFSVCAAQQKR